MELSELIGACIARNLPFFCYREPDGPLKMGVQTTPLQPQAQPAHLAEAKGFVMAPFGTDAPYFVIREDIAADAGHPAISSLPTLPRPDMEKAATDKCISREEYMRKVAAAVKMIKAGELDKVVLSHPHFEQGDYLSRAPQLLGKLLENYPSAFVAMANLPGHGLWTCATPELLIKRNKLSLNTIALAGTRKAQDEDTPWDEKNTEEQQIVEDYIVDTLFPFCSGVVVAPVRTTRAGHLEHLVTHISTGLKEEAKTDDILTALHPTPAVCGQPKAESYAYLLANEGYDRGFYSGYLGHADAEDQLSLYVNLRCMKLTEKGATLYAGGGITANSDPATEWEETEAKIETLRRFLKV